MEKSFFFTFFGDDFFRPSGLILPSFASALCWISIFNIFTDWPASIFFLLTFVTWKPENVIELSYDDICIPAFKVPRDPGDYES